MTDIQYMKIALKLAKKGMGNTLPNPMVCAVIVKNDRIIGKGFHKRVGSPHAEIEAIRKEDSTQGSESEETSPPQEDEEAGTKKTRRKSKKKV